MVRKHLAPLGLAILLFFLSILAVGPVTQGLVSRYIKPGVIETASERLLPSLFQGTLLQSLALRDPTVVPMYGSSEFSHGGPYNPMKLFAGKRTGWTPYLVGHAGSVDLIQALYAGAQDLKGRKIVLSLSAQWFHPGGVSQSSFAANFSALQAYKLMSNPALTVPTKKALAQRLSKFNEVKKSYPVLEGLLENYGQTAPSARLQESLYWPAAKVEMASLEIQDAWKTTKVLEHLPAKTVARNAKLKPNKTPLNWAGMLKTATANVAKNENSNPFGINNHVFETRFKNLRKEKNSARKGRLYPSPEYTDLNLLMQVLKEEGAKPIFLIQPVNGLWYDYTGFPKQQRQKYYNKIRQMAAGYGFATADFSGHENDKYFMDDPSHPSEKGWLEFDKALDKFVHQKS